MDFQVVGRGIKIHQVVFLFQRVMNYDRDGRVSRQAEWRDYHKNGVLEPFGEGTHESIFAHRWSPGIGKCRWAPGVLIMEGCVLLRSVDTVLC